MSPRLHDAHSAMMPHIAAAVSAAVKRSGRFAGYNVQFEIRGSELVLVGDVRSYYLKQLAQESVRGLCGYLSIRNELTVRTLPQDFAPLMHDD